MSNVTAPSAVRRAEGEIATLLAACADYQRSLALSNLPDPIAGRIEGICKKYGVELTPRSQYGETPGKHLGYTTHFGPQKVRKQGR